MGVQKVCYIFKKDGFACRRIAMIAETIVSNSRTLELSILLGTVPAMIPVA